MVSNSAAEMAERMEAKDLQRRQTEALEAIAAALVQILNELRRKA